MIQNMKHLALLLLSLLVVQCNVFCNDPILKDQNEEQSDFISKFNLLPYIRAGKPITLTEEDLTHLNQGDIVESNSQDGKHIFVTRIDALRKINAFFGIAGITTATLVLAPIIWCLYKRSASFKERLDRQVYLSSNAQ